MATVQSDQQRSNLYTSTSDVDYVPLSNYPANASYTGSGSGPSGSSRTNPLEAAMAPMDPSRWRILNLIKNPRTRRATWAAIFLFVAVILAAVAVASPKLYRRKYWTDPTDGVSVRLGYTVELKEKIGLFRACYDVKTTPLASNSTGVASHSSHCTSVWSALKSVDEGKPQKPLPKTSNIAKHHHHRAEKKKGSAHCYLSTVKYSLMVMFAFVGVTLIICVARKFASNPRAIKAGMAAHPIPIVLGFMALSLAVLTAAAGSKVMAEHDPPQDFYDALQGNVGPSEWSAQHRHCVKLSCSMTLLAASWACFCVSMLISLVHSSREYERFHLTGSLDEPLITH